MEIGIKFFNRLQFLAFYYVMSCRFFMAHLFTSLQVYFLGYAIAQIPISLFLDLFSPHYVSFVILSSLMVLGNAMFYFKSILLANTLLLNTCLFAYGILSAFGFLSSIILAMFSGISFEKFVIFTNGLVLGTYLMVSQYSDQYELAIWITFNCIGLLGAYIMRKLHYYYDSIGRYDDKGNISMFQVVSVAVSDLFNFYRFKGFKSFCLYVSYCAFLFLCTSLCSTFLYWYFFPYLVFDFAYLGINSVQVSVMCLLSYMLSFSGSYVLMTFRKRAQVIILILVGITQCSFIYTLKYLITYQIMAPKLLVYFLGAVAGGFANFYAATLIYRMTDGVTKYKGFMIAINNCGATGSPLIGGLFYSYINNILVLDHITCGLILTGIGVSLLIISHANAKEITTK